MFSYGIWEGLGLFNSWITCAVTKKNYGKNIFSLVWNFDRENFSSSHLWYQAKNNPIFRNFLLSSRPSDYSVLKVGRYLILYIRGRNSWQRLVTECQCVKRRFWAPCDSSCQEDPKSVYLLFCFAFLLLLLRHLIVFPALSLFCKEFWPLTFQERDI